MTALHPDDHERAAAAFWGGIRSGGAFTSEARFRRISDGEYRWHLNRGIPLRDSAGNLIKFVGTSTDIEDLKRAEEALRASERDFRLIVDTIPGMVCTLKADWEVEFVNQPLREYFGKTLEELKDWEFIGVVHPDDIERVVAKTRHSTATGEPYEVEHRCLRHDGVFRWFQVRARPLRDAAGHLVRWYLLLTDIEDRKRAEEALKASERNLSLIINTMPVLAWSALSDGSVEFLSQRWLEYTGFSAEQAKDWGWTAALHRDDAEGLIKIWQSSLVSGAPLDTEARLRRFDGEYRWFLFGANPLRDESGNIVKWYGTAADIEDRKQAEQQLRRNEWSLLEAQRLGHSGSWSLDVSSRTVTATPEILRAYDVRPGEDPSNGDFWMSRIHPEDRKQHLDVFVKSLAEKTDYDVVYRVLLPDGRIRHQHSIGHPIVNDSGDVVEVMGTSIDITEEVETRDALLKAFAEIEKSEDQLRAIISTIPALVWSASPEGTAEFFNQPWLDYTGLAPGQAAGWGWTVAIHPGDLDRMSNWVRNAITTGESVPMEGRIRRFDGEYRWFLVRANPLRDELGNIVKWYGIITDIDDRKRAEEQLRRSEAFLAEGQRLSQTGTFSWRVDTNEIIWSEELYRICGFDPDVPVTRERIGSLLHPEDIPFWENMDAAAHGFDFEHRIVMLDGSIKYIHLIGHAVRDVEGRLEFFGAVHDITQRRLAEEAVAKSRSELASVMRAASLGALTASIAHEVNQPLSGIITNAGTCLRMLDSNPPNIDGARETARRTIRDGNRASDVITRLRALFKRKAVVAEPVDLNEATREVIALSLADLQRNRVILRHELADDLPLVAGDRVQLQQVIMNLLRNAVDAMTTIEDRPRQLMIKTESDDGLNVRLTVQDAGIGFAPDVIDRLFESFYTTKDNGMGVGLAISRSIVESHGGRLWATRNDGPGSTFVFSVPVPPTRQPAQGQ